VSVLGADIAVEERWVENADAAAAANDRHGGQLREINLALARR
jgi:hypothetical protein